MEVKLTVEQEGSQIAAQSGRRADELACEAVDACLIEDRRFQAGVRAGQEAAGRADFLPASEVWAKVERALKA